MAIRQINATDSLETLRSQFNTLAAQDFGDIANIRPVQFHLQVLLAL